MTLDTTDDIQQFRRLVESFAEDRLAPLRSTTDRYPFDPAAPAMISAVHDEMTELGLLGVTLPEDHGGVGLDLITLCMTLRALAAVDASHAAFVLTNVLAQDILLEAGDTGLLTTVFTSNTASKDTRLSTPSFSDPRRTSRLPQASATDESGPCVVNGTVDDLVLGAFARWAVVPVHIAPAAEFTYVLIDLESAGVKFSEPVISLGLHACPSTDVELTEVPARIIGRAGKGAELFAAVAPRCAAATAAIAAGIMHGALTDASAYTRERTQGGRLLVGWSEVRSLLAEMEMRSRCADLSVEQVGRRMVDGVPESQQDARAVAALVHEMSAVVVDHGVQLFGGGGYTKDYGQEKRYRDARQVQTLLGAPAVKKNDLVPPPPMAHE